MKLFGDKIDIGFDHICWGPHYLPNDPARFGELAGKFYDHNYYLYWWNRLPKELRYVGYEQFWYDGPISSFGLWWTNISWVLPWTSHDGSRCWSIRAK